MTGAFAVVAVTFSLATGVPALGPAEVPPMMAAPLQKAEAAVTLLQQRLQARLTAALSAGGPAAAVAVCRDEAPAIAAGVSRGNGVAVGRTSDRLRNPANGPPAWAVAAVVASVGKKAEEVRAASFDLGDRVGFLRPIVVVAPCLACHGAAGSIAPEIREVLAKAYPTDRATGYAAGDLRGFFWAEVRKKRASLPGCLGRPRRGGLQNGWGGSRASAPRRTCQT